MENKLIKMRLCHLDGTCICESTVQTQQMFSRQELLSVRPGDDGGIEVFASSIISPVGLMVFHAVEKEKGGFCFEFEVLDIGKPEPEPELRSRIARLFGKPKPRLVA